MKLLAAALIALAGCAVTSCDSGPSCSQRGGHTVYDAPTLIMMPNYDGKGNMIGFNQIWIPQSHCEGATK